MKRRSGCRAEWTVAAMKELPLGLGIAVLAYWALDVGAEYTFRCLKASSPGKNHDRRQGAYRQDGHLKPRAPASPCVRGSGA